MECRVRFWEWSDKSPKLRNPNVIFWEHEISYFTNLNFSLKTLSHISLNPLKIVFLLIQLLHLVTQLKVLFQNHKYHNRPKITSNLHMYLF